MTRMRPSILIALGVAASLCVIALQAHRVSAARQRHDAAIKSLNELQRDAAKIIELRAKRDLVAWRERPKADVLALVNAALVDAGIPTNRLQGIGEGVDTPVTNTGGGDLPLRRQSLAISFDGLTPAQIGLLLERWDRVQDQWSAGRLELTHRRDPTQPDLYDLRLHISAVYLAGSESGR